MLLSIKILYLIIFKVKYNMYQNKYFKYKNKYLNLKYTLRGGAAAVESKSDLIPLEDSIPYLTRRLYENPKILYHLI